jgi:hypothetical protein
MEEGDIDLRLMHPVVDLDIARPRLSQAQGILALDFCTADLLNGAKVYVLAVIEHGTRRVRVLGATRHPVQAWVVR